MSDEVEYLDLDDLMAAAEMAIGRRPEVRDWGLLESALAQPKASVFGENAYPTIDVKAAALLHSLVTNRALVDGNKRLGLASVLLFYGMNGCDLSATEDERVERIVDIAVLGGVAPGVATQVGSRQARSPNGLPNSTASPALQDQTSSSHRTTVPSRAAS